MRNIHFEFFCFNMLLGVDGKSKRSKSMHPKVKDLFSLDDYYTNSAVQEANAIPLIDTEQL